MTNSQTDTYYFSGKEHFAIAKYHMRGHDTRLFRANSHNEFELLQIIEGQGHFIYEGRFFELRPNRLFLVNGRRLHYTNPDDPRAYLRNVVEFSCDDLINILSIYNQVDLLEPFLHPNTSVCCIDLNEETSRIIDGMFRDISLELLDNKPGCVPVSMSYVIRIIACSLRNKVQSNDPKNRPWNIKEQHVIDIINYLTDHLAQFSFDDMSEELSLSKYYICHLFKQTTGLTVQNYLLARRFEKARQLLATSDLSVSQISEALGFSSFSLFSRCFRQAHNMTPVEFRRQQRSQTRFPAL